MRASLCVIHICILDKCEYHCVHGELCTYMCGSGSGVAVVRSAVDREAAIASRSVQCSEER